MNSSLYYCGERRELLSYLPQQYSRVLEIGCGAGGFRSNLNKEHEYWGVEPVAEIAAVASKSLDHVLVGTYEQIHEQLPDNYFDMIICNDVIEHMIDPWLFFSLVRNKLSSDGVIVGSIPNVRFILNLYELLVDKDWEYKENGVLDKTHVRFFTKISLGKFCYNCGYNILFLEGINPYLPMKFKFKMLKSLSCFLLGNDVLYKQFAFVLSDARKIINDVP